MTSSSVLAVVDTNGFVHAACEVEPATDAGFVRLLGSWGRSVAPCLRVADVERIVPVVLGDGSECGSVAEWAEGRGYRMAVTS